jgi:hypothetical protein
MGVVRAALRTAPPTRGVAGIDEHMPSAREIHERR